MDQTRSTGTDNNNHSSAERGNIDNTHAKNSTQTAALNHGAVEQPGQQESMFRLSNNKKKHLQTQGVTKTMPTNVYNSSTTCMHSRARAFENRNHKAPSRNC